MIVGPLPCLFEMFAILGVPIHWQHNKGQSYTLECSGCQEVAQAAVAIAKGMHHN